VFFAALDYIVQFTHSLAGKKLKKRLEDLERRAGSSSASPEQRPVELSRSDSVASMHASSTTASRPRSTSSQLRRDHTPDVMAQTYVLPLSEDRGMFSQQYTRQLSTSPPPFAYATLGGNDTNSNYTTYSQPNAYCNMPPTMDIPLYPSYMQPIQQPYTNGMATPPIKQEFYAEDEVNPFSMSYASITGVDVSTTVGPSYQDVAAAYVSTTTAHPPVPYARSYSYPQWRTVLSVERGLIVRQTPSLSDSFEHSSPPNRTTYPRTPESMSGTPPMHFYDHYWLKSEYENTMTATDTTYAMTYESEPRRTILFS
jgi:hypothetical protein